MSSRLTAPPRVAVVLPLSLTWQPVVANDLTDDRARLLARATAALADGGLALVEAALVGSEAEAAQAGARAAERDAEVALVLATMAVLASVPLAALDRMDGCPVVVWAIAQGDPLDERADHARIVLDGGTVGGPVLTSMLARHGRPFEVILGALDDDETLGRVERALRAGAAARRVARARVGRVGRSTPGYGCVDVDEAQLRAGVGTAVIDIESHELTDAYRAVPDPRTRAIADEIRAAYAVDTALTDEDLARAARAAAALEALVEAHDLDAGALTCHVDGIRFGVDALGFAPCFALGRMTSRGVPWCCSADLPAALALLTLKALGAAAQYHELEALDPAAGDFLVASSGEHDLAFAGEPPRLRRNAWFPDDEYPSACACFAAPAGPATLLGFAQITDPTPGHRLVVASGTFADRGCAGAGTPNARFRFAHGNAADTWAAWCAAGVGLHAAATPGEHAASLDLVGHFLGLKVVDV